MVVSFEVTVSSDDPKALLRVTYGTLRGAYGPCLPEQGPRADVYMNSAERR